MNKQGNKHERGNDKEISASKEISKKKALPLQAAGGSAGIACALEHWSTALAADSSVRLFHAHPEFALQAHLRTSSPNFISRGAGPLRPTRPCAIGLG